MESVATLLQPEPELDDGDEIETHQECADCAPGTSLCGLDMTGEEWTDGGTPESTCPMCLAVEICPICGEYLGGVE